MLQQILQLLSNPGVHELDYIFLGFLNLHSRLINILGLLPKRSFTYACNKPEMPLTTTKEPEAPFTHKVCTWDKEHHSPLHPLLPLSKSRSSQHCAWVAARIPCLTAPGHLVSIWGKVALIPGHVLMRTLQTLATMLDPGSEKSRSGHILISCGSSIGSLVLYFLLNL